MTTMSLKTKLTIDERMEAAGFRRITSQLSPQFFVQCGGSTQIYRSAGGAWIVAFFTPGANVPFSSHAYKSIQGAIDNA